MKLRNKKTGEIVENFDGFTTFTNDWSSVKNLQYTSLAKLNDDWEDYEPAEPLMKDVKIRKAVRAWAIANDLTCCHYECGEFEQEYAEMCAGISFGEKTDYLEERRYTIAELCGEEEE
jgi:hypothetical protein